MLKYDFNKVTLIVTLERCWFGNTYIKWLKIFTRKTKVLHSKAHGRNLFSVGRGRGEGFRARMAKKNASSKYVHDSFDD